MRAHEPIARAIARRASTGMALALGAALAATLAGCAAEPAPAAQHGASAAVTPSAPPTTAAVDPLDTVVTLVATPEGLVLRDAAGTTVSAFDYRSDAAAALAALEAVFGTAPESEELHGSLEHAPSTAHRWGGFELREQRYVDDWAQHADSPTLRFPAFRVAFTSPERGGVGLATADGVRVGDAWETVAADPRFEESPSHCSGPFVDAIEAAVTYDGVERIERIVVGLHPTDDGARLAYVSAPEAADGCA